MSIQMGNYTLMKYHSDRLGFDINYPSFLYRQELPDDAGMQELFMMDDISVSFMVDSLHNVLRTSGQTLLAMGADLVDVGDDYSGILQQGDQQRHAAPGHNHPALLSRARRSHGTPQGMGPRLPNHPVTIMLR